LYNLEDQTYMKADYVFGITADWRIYDPSTNQILLEKSTRDSISYEVNGKTRDIVEKKLPSNLSAAEKAGILTGEQFARSILPTYKTVLRYYYGGGNKALRQATTFVRFRNWDEASEIWEAQLENANLSVKAKIWYNLALLSEMEGRPDEAISYLKKANQFHRDNATEKYQNTIIQEWNLNTGRL
jgi:tetratricopeptide (TPR) repeat protein